MTTETPTQRIDRVLGRLVLRAWAIVAVLAAAASIAFGSVVLSNGQFPGLLMLLLGVFFFWLGLRAWRDRAGVGEMLNRDFERPAATGTKKGSREEHG